jgi:hypothetical protein
MLFAHVDWSDRAIALEIGVSHTLVQNTRRELERSGQLATVASRTGTDGRRRSLPARAHPPEPPAERPIPKGAVRCPNCGVDFRP